MAWISTLAAPSTRGFVALALGIVALRLVAVWASPVELGPDEAQYWGWAQTPALGYFSKPPLVGWAIAASTTLFGESEAAIRTLSPLLHGLTALLVFALARTLGFPGAAGAAGLIYLLMPAVTLSSAIISTDALLMPAWTAGLIALWRFRETGRWGWAAAWGAALAIGMLAKYAAIYALIGTALAIALDPTLRARALAPAALAGPVTFLALLGPHLAWNAVNGFAPVAHLADNANWSVSDLFNPEALAEFALEQLGVFGPIAFAGLIALGLWRGWPQGAAGKDAARFLACFVLPPLLIVGVQAFLARANANWAAAAYPAASVLVALWAVSLRRRWVLGLNATLNGAIAGLFLALIISPSLADALGLANAFKRARGWEATTEAIAQQAAACDCRGVIVDNRLLFHELSYYADPGYAGAEARLGGAPVFIWKRFSETVSHAEAIAGLKPGAEGPFLLASVTPGYNIWFQADFRVKTQAGAATIPLGGGQVRTIVFYRVEGYAPASRAALAPADAVER
jgi:4-amino-4-deoxy-L-arabinose transferase-like glycosyltransferase